MIDPILSVIIPTLENIRKWPPNIVYLMFFLLLVLVFLVIYAKIALNISKNPKVQDYMKHQDQIDSFHKFQKEFLIVYLLVMLADWLQGTNMYTLYQSYQVDIGTLFITGFLTSAIVGTVIGPIIDIYGRRQACLVFCILEIVINLIEHSSSVNHLIIGRFLGGISTSLLFSAFESWMVTEHHRRGFPPELISSTFCLASIGNGLVAIMAGILSQIMTDHLGDIGSFQLAILITIIATCFVYSWPENYGTSSNNLSLSFWSKISSFWNMIIKDDRITLVGLGHSFFEGSMYTFVFMWVPTLQTISTSGMDLPVGLIFSCLMVSISIGGECYEIFRRVASDELIAVCLSLSSVFALLLVSVSTSFHVVLFGFIWFEICVGASFPCCGTLRSKYFPSEIMSTTMNVFRLPLNTLVVVGTKLGDNFETSSVFGVASCWLVCSFLAHVILYKSIKDKVI